MDKLRPKYDVQRVGPDGDLIGPRMNATDPENPDSPFVLMPRKDPAAFTAVMTYARHCEPDLAAEIRDWLRKVANAPPEYGTQGTRNLSNMRLDAIDALAGEP